MEVKTFVYTYPPDGSGLSGADTYWVKIRFNDRWTATDSYYDVKYDALLRAEEIARDTGGKYAGESWNNNLPIENGDCR